MLWCFNSYSSLKSESDGVARVWNVTDWYGASKSTVDGFSKYDVATVWVFYDLWQFNMIVGFAGVFVTFAIMISIVIGLMSRLIKGAALFLVYPSILGIAPLDDFKAFKSWGQMFMQQIMMAFGSIVGMNLLLLILPYVQQIEFFEVAIINYIVNVVMMVTGLIMAKDFISIVSGFVGGADANASGGEMKGQVAGAIKAGVGTPARILGGGARITGALAYKGVNKAYKGLRKAKQARIGARVNKAIEEGKKDLDSKQATLQSDQNELEKRRSQISANVLRTKTADFASAGDAAFNKAIAEGYSEGKANQLRDEAVENAKQEAINSALSSDSLFSSLKDNVEKSSEAVKHSAEQIDPDKMEINTSLSSHKKNPKMEKIKDLKARGILKEKLDEEGKPTGTYWAGSGKDLKEDANEYLKNLKQGAKDVASAIANALGEALGKGQVFKAGADSFIKTLSSASNTLGLDKSIETIKKEFGESLTYKGGPFKPKKEGDALQRQIAGDQKKQADKQTELLKEISKKLDKQNNSSGNSGGTPPASKP